MALLFMMNVFYLFLSIGVKGICDEYIPNLHQFIPNLVKFGDFRGFSGKFAIRATFSQIGPLSVWLGFSPVSMAGVRLGARLGLVKLWRAVRVSSCRPVALACVYGRLFNSAIWRGDSGDSGGFGRFAGSPVRQDSFYMGIGASVYLRCRGACWAAPLPASSPGARIHPAAGRVSAGANVKAPAGGPAPALLLRYADIPMARFGRRYRHAWL